MIERRYTDVDIQRLVSQIQDETEWLETTEEDDVECISIEILEGILTRFLNTQIKLKQDDI
jgi:hypothetical protein